MVVIVIFLLGVGLFIGQTSRNLHLGMREVKSFKADGVCLITTDPACGYCPGDVTDGKCYVKYSELKQYN